MTTKFTPGPWFVGAQNDGLFIIDKPPRPSTDYITAGIPDLTVVAKIYPVNVGEERANADLIAAAPELLAALAWCVANEGERLTDHLRRLSAYADLVLQAGGER